MPEIDSFTHDGRHYSLAKVRVMLRTQTAFLLPIEKLLWVQDHDAFDEDRVVNAKIRWPLIVTKWKDPKTGKTKWTVVDGLHRLERYRRRGIKRIPCKEVTSEMLKKALIS